MNNADLSRLLAARNAEIRELKRQQAELLDALKSCVEDLFDANPRCVRANWYQHQINKVKS